MYSFHLSYILGPGTQAQECRENEKDTLKCVRIIFGAGLTANLNDEHPPDPYLGDAQVNFPRDLL